MGKHKYILLSVIWISLLLFSACSISYTFNAATIDYTKTKTISIKPFPNMAMLVYPMLSQMLTEEIEDKFITKTKLQMVRTNGDLDLEGEITGYDLMQMNAKPTEGNDRVFASQTRLTVTIRVRYENRANPEKDFENNYSAFREFDNSKTIDDVQSQLCQEIVEELVDQIYNTTVADW